MIRPGLTFALWLAVALLVVLNDAVGDTWIAATLAVRAVEWYKALVPLPYVVLMALIHARRTAGPRWFGAALLAALLWPTSTVLVDFLYVRLTYGVDPAAFLDRFAGPYPLLVALFARRCWPGNRWSAASNIVVSRSARNFGSLRKRCLVRDVTSLGLRSARVQGQRASGGSDIRIASTLPPVIRPNRVPRSCSRLNST